MVQYLVKLADERLDAELHYDTRERRCAVLGDKGYVGPDDDHPENPHK